MIDTMDHAVRRADLVVVGGGLAGLSAAALVAKQGHSVLILEQSKELGGRAVTQVRHDVLFNMGPHAVYCHGHAFRLFRELGVPFAGRSPRQDKVWLLTRGELHRFPAGVGTLLGSRLLTVREKARLLGFLTRLGRLDARRFDHVPLKDWLEETAGTGGLAAVLETLLRVSTYTHDPARLSAGAAINQLKTAARGNVWYLDGGWQTLVDGLRERAEAHGARIRISSHVKAVRNDGDEIVVELGGGQEVHCGAAILAVPPRAACELLELPPEAPLAAWTEQAIPVRAACLDVALESLPRPEHLVTFGIEEPFYFSVHSASANLAPPGVAVLHVMKYLRHGDAASPGDIEAELEAFLDRIQPGWPSRVRSQRFLPGMTVTHSLALATQGGLAGRPDVAVHERPNVFVAGDWVSGRGMLADAAAASAEESARRVLESLSTRAGLAERSLSHVAL